jgi:CHAT domain-containing protein
LGVEAIQRDVLGSGRALVEYVLGESKSYVFVLGASGLVSAELPGRAEIEREVAAYRRELSGRVTGLTVAGAMGRYSVSSRKMYSLLVGPVEKALAGNRELIVVPDGVLAYVPFETLTGDGPLVAKFAIAYAPSASALAGLRTRAGAGVGGTLLALGDPVYGPAAGLAKLPNTRGEVTAIGALFGAGERRIYLGAEAKVGQLKGADLLGVRYLHVAAHGVLDEEAPGRSGVVLSDGVLEVPEILRLRMRAEMVTLSACQTGLGKVLAGEGVMGLSRAFLFAGARSVVVSLWNVNDAATAELMKAFYGNLKRGVGAAEALRLAKLGLANGAQRAWRHPYFWAGFVFVGDGVR